MKREYSNEKPLGKFTNKEWRGFIIALTFFGIFIIGLGIKDLSWNLISLGLIFTGIGMISGFVLHFVFGIKIIQMRRDFKYDQNK